MTERWAVVDELTIHEGWARFLQLVLRNPHGELIRREVEDHGHAAAVLPYDPRRGTALLVRQVRTPLLLQQLPEPLLEVPAGRLDGEDAVTAGRREAKEECGVDLGELEYLGKYWTMPGLSTESIAMFLASYDAADRTSPGGGLLEESEFIEVVELPLRQLHSMWVNGEVADLKTAFMMLALKERRPELFD